MRRIPLLLALCVLLAIGAEGAPDRLVFSPPLRLSTAGPGFEPGIDVDSRGVLYVTAHKSSLLVEGDRLASWLWYSADDGHTWHDLPSPFQMHEAMYALEGDLAIDARDRVYFVDTYLADNTFTRWSPGPIWDHSVVAQGTTLFDDRPWLAAHGDGIVYYVGNNVVAAAPSPDDLAGGSYQTARATLYRSTDGGLTWSIGRGLQDSGWCNVEASPLDDVTVHTVCVTDAPPRKVFVGESHDRGETFVTTHIGTIEGKPLGLPSLTVDRAGNVYTVWVDGAFGVSSTLVVARGTPDGKWTTFEVPTPPSKIERPWIDSGSAGVVAIAYDTTPDVLPMSASEWKVHVAVSWDADGASPSWEIEEVSGVVARGVTSPADFLTTTVGPDDRVHVVYGSHIPPPDLAHLGMDNEDVYYTGQR